MVCIPFPQEEHIIDCLEAQEIATLREQAQAFQAVRKALRTPSEANAASRLVFEKVCCFLLSLVLLTRGVQIFNTDIRNLLAMSDMWRSRTPPGPLDFDGIMDGTFSLRQNAPPTNGQSNGQPVVNGSAPTNGSTPAAIKDQRALSLKDNVSLFVSRSVRSMCEEDTFMIDHL